MGEAVWVLRNTRGDGVEGKVENSGIDNEMVEGDAVLVGEAARVLSQSSGRRRRCGRLGEAVFKKREVGETAGRGGELLSEQGNRL